jgi:hypothetical protein
MLIDAPPSTDTWYPTRHGSVLETVEQMITNAGMVIDKAEYAVSKGGARFFCTLDLTSEIVPGVKLAIGLRNSHDKAFAINLTAGSRVFVCDNLAFCSDIYVAKKHTRYGRLRFDEGISKALANLGQFKALEAHRIARYKDVPVTETVAKAAILTAYEQQIIGVRQLDATLHEWKRPSHAEFADRTAWALFNCFTEVLKAKQRQPQQFAGITMKLYGLVDTLADYAPRDVIAV